MNMRRARDVRISMAVMQLASPFWTNSNAIIEDADEAEYEHFWTPRTYCPSPTSSHIIQIHAGDENTCKKHLQINLMSFRCFADFLEVKRHGWNRDIEAIIFLFWLAAGCSYRVVSLAINVPRSTAFDMISKVLLKSLEIIPKVIKYPSEGDEQNAISTGFERKGKAAIFHRAAGAIDGTYASVLCPPYLQDEYIIRKLRDAIQLQVLCDSSGKLSNIFTGYPGSVHDQRVFRNSPLYLNAEYPPPGYFILGDSGYKTPTTPVPIVVPYKRQNLHRDKKIFNTHHSLARSVVERSIGAIKNRRRYLFGDRPIELKIEKAVKVIAVCCALHNICVTNGDVLDELSVHSSGTDPIEYDDSPEQPPAVQFRDELCAALLRELRE